MKHLFISLVFKIFLILILSFALLTFNLGAVSAQTISNPQYKLDINISNSYKNTQIHANEVQEKPQPTSQNIHLGENYKLIYPSDNNLFVFSISPTFIDYGILSPANSIKRTNTISVLTKHPFGYAISVGQNHKLRTSSKTEIPDTSCDTGMCSVSTADLWKNSLTYGFGYRCDNLYDVPSCKNDFSNLNYYKRFPNISESQDPQPIIQQTSSINSKAQITYQLNVSRTQEEGSYNNAIIFIATPNF